MEPIEMPESWHNQFVGLKIPSGHSFRISKDALTDSIMQVAKYAIDIDGGIVLKHRYGHTGQADEVSRVNAKKWPILHERRFSAGIMRALERLGALGYTPCEPVMVERAWEPEMPSSIQYINRTYGTR